MRARTVLPVLAFLACAPAPAARVISVAVEGVVHPVTHEILSHAIDQAQRERADLLLIRLNTPGGLMEATRDILGYSVIDGDIRPWAGLRPATPSGRPIIGQFGLQNLILNVGHGALGWTLAGGSARLVCDVIAQRPPTIAMAPFQYSALEVLHASRVPPAAPPVAR